jgi:hypothetical protein
MCTQANVGRPNPLHVLVYLAHKRPVLKQQSTLTGQMERGGGVVKVDVVNALGERQQDGNRRV